MKTSSPFDALSSICDEHEALTLVYHRAQAAFRQAIFSGEGSLPALKKEVLVAKKALDEFVLRRGERLISLAYKKTARINYQRQPNLSPVAQNTGREQDLAATKSVLVRRFEALKEGGNLNFKQETSEYFHIRLLDGEEEALTFTIAKINPQGTKHLLMFCEWSFSAQVVAEATAGKKHEPHRFILPLSIHVATESKARELVEWVYYSLGEQHFQSPVPDATERISEAVEALRVLRVVDEDRLAKDYPEVVHVVEGTKSHMDREPEQSP